MSVFFTRRGAKPYMGKMLSDYAIGESVFLTINGTEHEFLVVHHGNPDTEMYDSSCDGTWLLSKYIYTRMAFDGKNNNYRYSDVHTYLNGTFLGLLDTEVQNVIKQVKVPYGVYNSSHGINPTVYSGANGVSTKIFLPATGECGYIHGTGTSYQAKDGANLTYFVGVNSYDEEPKRVTSFNGTDSRWWTRTCYGGSQSSMYYVMDTGRFSYESITATYGGVRPMLIMPSETKFHIAHNTFLEA